MVYNNHVSSHAQLIENELRKKFGIGLNLLDRALNGDSQALKLIGALRKKAELAEVIIPEAEEALIAHYKATEAYNAAATNILKQGGKSASKINQLQGKVSLANSRFYNERREQTLNQKLESHAETSRSSYAMLLARAKSQMSQHLLRVEQQSALHSLENQPQVKQLAANRKYEVEMTKHLIANGDESKPELIERKDYSGINKDGFSSIFDKLRRLVTS